MTVWGSSNALISIKEVVCIYGHRLDPSMVWVGLGVE